MAFQLERGERISDSIKRIMTEQADYAVALLTDDSADPGKAVHEARKSFKRARAVVRLVRDDIGETAYRDANITFRDAGRKLAGVRDSAVMLQTLDKVDTQFKSQLRKNTFKRVREQLTAYHESVSEATFNGADAAAEVVELLDGAKGRIGTWDFEHRGFKAITSGLSTVYQTGQRRMSAAYRAGEPEDFHEWRKYTKYLWHHMDVLSPVWPGVIDATGHTLHEISDLLGDANDLETLRHAVTETLDLPADGEDVLLLCTLLDNWREALHVQARPSAMRVYHEDPAAFTARLRAYYQAWCAEV